ncbi:MAG: type IV secretory system conjugative DNA transfer family protein [Acidimicrobiales bacterium]
MARPNAQSYSERETDLALVGIVLLMLTIGALWLAGTISAVISGHHAPHGHPLGELAAFAHVGDPSRGWHAPVGPAVLYWVVTTLTLTLLGFLAWGARRMFRPARPNGRSGDDPTKLDGLADRTQVLDATGPKALIAQAKVLRPSLDKPKALDVGWYLGHSRGVECWMGVRDSLVLLGPPGAGKGFNFVIPSILDAPGAVITTSTRPDNLTATMTARGGDRRPVSVFDPQGLAAGVPSSLRWSPIRGCERPQTAMIRAAALTAGGSKGVTDANFWEQQTQTAVRCLLHAAAISGQSPATLYEWSLHAAAAREAVSVLATHPAASPSWDRALDGIVSAEQRTRDSVWAMVANAFASLADPHVLAAVSPDVGEAFDPADFLARRGTLYLLGTASGASATASLVSALIEDVLDVARRLAAAAPGARLDPPLGLILDEAANYPLPSLGSLMSEGGGSGIPTMVVLQSLAQARDRWGRETAGAIWDSATAKVILPGSSNADDLADISRLLGERTVTEQSQSYQTGAGRGGTSISTSEHKRAVLDPSAIRTLKPGHGLLLFRSARPIMLTLRPWTSRPDAAQIRGEREQVESLIRQAAGVAWASRA